MSSFTQAFLYCLVTFAKYINTVHATVAHTRRVRYYIEAPV